MNKGTCPKCRIWYKHSRRVYVRIDGKFVPIGYVCLKKDCGNIWLDQGIKFSEKSNYYGPDTVVLERV